MQNFSTRSGLEDHIISIVSYSCKGMDSIGLYDRQASDYGRVLKRFVVRERRSDSTGVLQQEGNDLQVPPACRILSALLDEKHHWALINIGRATLLT
uniref:Uncharacterized protein n=1 Tax=Rangifer tarandus platyrhynchus TaxID=3082113 RepID=A0ACB0EN82_RANTA|nr:unnamed protein product [Rangifer tarandus platyrhynchus]